MALRNRVERNAYGYPLCGNSIDRVASYLRTFGYKPKLAVLRMLIESRKHLHRHCKLTTNDLTLAIKV